MSELVFARATKAAAKLRLALSGPSGTGKTYSALAIAQGLGERVALVDTERGSASKYAGDPFTFDTLELPSFAPAMYVQALVAAAAAGYDVVIIDSLSHAWSGKDGALDQVNRRRGSSGNSFAAWREVTPMHNELVDAILAAPLHIIATMRSRTGYAMETDDRGRVVPRKIGLAPIQREGVEYEFDVAGELDLAHQLRISKTRVRALDGVVISKPGRELGEMLRRWLTDLEASAPLEDLDIAAAMVEPSIARETSGAALSDSARRIVLEAAHDAGELVGRQAIADFASKHGYASWRDFEARGSADAPELIRTLQALNRRVYTAAR